MSVERVFDGRIVVVGYNWADARNAELTSYHRHVTYVSATGHLGSVAGMRLARVYATPRAQAHGGEIVDYLQNRVADWVDL